MGIVSFWIPDYPRYLEQFCLILSDGVYSDFDDCLANMVDVFSISIDQQLIQDGYLSTKIDEKTRKITMSEHDYLFFKLKWS